MVMNNLIELEDLKNKLKTYSNLDRIKIVGMIAIKSCTIKELSDKLDLKASAVNRHIQVLFNAELIEKTLDERKNIIYKINKKAVERDARKLYEGKSKEIKIAPAELGADDLKIVKHYFNSEGKLIRIPAHYKKLLVILKFILKDFTPGVFYSEKEVNHILSKYNDDTARLRRELIDIRFMSREGGGGQYWVDR